MKPIVIVMGIATLGLIVFYMGRQTYLTSLMHQYRNVVAVEENDLSYRSKQLPLLGGGVLFYQVQFKDVPFAHSVDKMTLLVSGSDVNVSLKGVRFRVDDALRSETDWEYSLRTYQPYEHVFTRPLETLALTGVNEVCFDASFSLQKDGLSRRVVGDIFDKKLGKAIFDFYIPVEMNKLSPSELSKATLLDGVFSFEDISIVNDYVSYANALGIKEPANWLTGILVK